MIYEDLKVPIFHEELCLLLVDTIKHVRTECIHYNEMQIIYQTK